MAYLATMRVATFALLPWMVAAQSASSPATETFTQSATPTGDFDDPYFMGYWIKSEEGTPAPYESKLACLIGLIFVLINRSCSHHRSHALGHLGNIRR